MQRKAKKVLSITLSLVLLVTLFVVAKKAGGSSIITSDDPHPNGGDIAVFDNEISIDEPLIVGLETIIGVYVHNLGLTQIVTWHYGDWVEWDFHQDVEETLDIKIRIRSIGDATITNVHLDLTKIATFDSMPEYDIITIPDVTISAGDHTIRITQMSDTPSQGDDLRIDWLEIGSYHIEAELYDRSSGSVSYEYRGVDRIMPYVITANFYVDNVSIGTIENISTHSNQVPGDSDYDVAYFIVNGGSVYISLPWTPSTPGIHTICIMVDSKSSMELNVSNNIACKTVYVLEESIEADIDIDPNTLNLKSKGKWITCYIELPSGYDVKDINASTILLEDSLQPILDPKYGFVKCEDSYIMDHDGDGVLERMVKFDRSEVEDMLSPGSYNLKVTGELLDGTPFVGYSDTIRVIHPP